MPIINLLSFLIVNTLAVVVADRLLPNVQVDALQTALIVGIVLGVVNTFIRPILSIITLPLNIVTLGFFSFILNGLLILAIGQVIPGFVVGGFVAAVLFNVIVSIVNAFLRLVL